MSTVGVSFLNLIDVVKMRGPDGKRVARVMEVLNLNNPITDDAIFVECNMGQQHLHTVRTGLPTVAWGALYQGIPQSKARTQQVTDTTGFVEAYSAVDKRLLEVSSDPDGIRMSQAAPFTEALNQEAATGIFYHDTATDPLKFKGLVAHGYNAISTSGPGAQIVDAGGSGSDNTSLWFVTWGENFTHMIYPQGTMAGVHHEDMGLQKTLDSNSNPYFTLDELWRWHLGLCVEDWRANSRIANLDVSDMAAGSVAIFTFLRKAYYKLTNRRQHRAGNSVANQVAIPQQGAIYCNRDVLQALDALATAGAGNTQLRYGELEGKEVLMYRDWPIRETDAILNTEARVT